MRWLPYYLRPNLYINYEFYTLLPSISLACVRFNINAICLPLLVLSFHKLSVRFIWNKAFSDTNSLHYIPCWSSHRMKAPARKKPQTKRHLASILRHIRFWRRSLPMVVQTCRARCTPDRVLVTFTVLSWRWRRYLAFQSVSCPVIGFEMRNWTRVGEENSNSRRYQ